MGLPQVPPSEIGEEVEAASLGTFLQGPPRFTDVSTCDMDGMHCENMRPLAGNPPCSSVRDFRRNTCLELSTVHEDSFKLRGAMEVTSNIHGMRIGSVDKGCGFTPRSGRNILNPVSRVVGFDSGGASLLNDGFKGISAVHVQSSAGSNVRVNETESSGSLVRKRLLSPLSSMLSPDQFNGDPLDIGCRDIQANSPAMPHNISVSVAKDNKKANVGSQNLFASPTWSLSGCLEQKNKLNDNDRKESMLFTDGPLIQSKEQPASYSCFLSSPALDIFRESSKVRSQSGAISISPKKALSPPLCLSPLGPKISERMKTAGVCWTTKNEMGCHLTLKNIEQPLERSERSTFLAPEEEGYRIASKSFEDIYILQRECHSSSLESDTDIGWPFSQEPAPASRGVRYPRSLSGLPVRRSLVGSFEESLLSGRFLSGKLSQVSNDFMLCTYSVSGKLYLTDIRMCCLLLASYL